MARKVEFDLTNIKLLDDGKLSRAFGKEVQYAVRDCIDRPTEDKERIVNVIFRISPKLATGERDCDKVNVACDIKSSIPTRKSQIYDMRVHTDGKLSFHPDIPEDADADGIFDEEANKEDGTKG